MKYIFPQISHIGQVLPHIEGRSEFVVAQREHYTIIDYMVNKKDTFDLIDENDLGGKIRREVRGLIFSLDGKLISRPFHKFFNVNEREETQESVIQELMSNSSYTIMRKEDGSMVRPLIIDKKVVLGTKMGHYTDVAKEATKLLTEGQKFWLEHEILAGNTPILEYVGPENKIVLQYNEPKLILLNIRHNLTGKYFKYLPNYIPFECVKYYNSTELSFSEYVKDVRGRIDVEGDILQFDNGHMIKIKADQYVLMHKTKDDIRSDKNITELYMKNELDDKIPLLDATDRQYVMDYITQFENDTENVLDRLIGLYGIAVTVYDKNPKRIALEFVPNLLQKADASFIFAMIRGQDLRTLVDEYILRHLGSGTKFDELIGWMKA